MIFLSILLFYRTLFLCGMNNFTKKMHDHKEKVYEAKKEKAKQHIFFKFHIKAQKTFGLGQMKNDFSTKSIKYAFFLQFWPK